MAEKSGNEEFDVPMGCFDGAEVCDLIGVYIMNLLQTVMRKENVGLYGDEGLDILQNYAVPEEQKRKIIQIFKSCRLYITVKANLKTADFLDVRFDLVSNTYQPYRKPNSETVHINKHSNHPPNILKEPPKAIDKQQIFHVTRIFLILQKAHTNKHYAKVVLMKNENIIKIVRNKLETKKRGREEGRLYVLIHPFL